METSLVVSENKDVSILFNKDLFEHSYRVAKMLCSSTMVPAHFQGEKNIGNCMIALNLSHRMGLDPFMVMQKMYVIQGKPGIEAQLIIAVINASGKFSQLQFRLEGEGMNRKCTAYATNMKTGELCEQVVSMAMAQAEKWIEKPGSKWKTMPDLMLQYRSAAFFGRLYCPETLLGLRTTDEIHDTIDLTQNSNGTFTAVSEKIKAVSESKPEETAKYKPKKENVGAETTVSSVPEELLKAVNDAFDIDYQTAKATLIEVGVDSTGNLNEEQARKFLAIFEKGLGE